MQLGVLIPLLVPLITEILKMIAASIDKKPPAPVYPASTAVTGMALAPLMGVDADSGAVLGMAGSAVYEGGLKPLIKKLKQS